MIESQHDLTPPEHEHNDLVFEAARWLADQPPGIIRPPVPELRRRFNLSPVEACEASALARQHQTWRFAAA